MAERVIATETVVVHDDTLNIDRRVVEGQPVPRDLVNAYEGRGAKPTGRSGAKASGRPPAAKADDDTKSDG